MENNKKDKQQSMSWIRGDCIGRGAHASVNLAVTKSNATIFAVKSVDQAYCLPSQLQALENEIRISRKVSSPYVVEYFGDDITLEKNNNSWFRNLHMEYLPGGAVADVAGKLDELIIKRYTWCIVSAVNYLHTQLGIIHCDIKGENILVGPGKSTAKLADFGSAIDLGVSEEPRGSPLWMAPEVVRGEYQGPESDVWSIGCTVIEMVTGKPPWKMGFSAADTLCRIGYSDEVPSFPEGLSELGKDFLDKCLKRVAKERWSCDQLLSHPFLLPCSQSDILFPSPRGVLDWLPSEDDDDYVNIQEEILEDGENYDIVCERYRSQISGLASGAGALWESNGWLVVREMEGVEEFTEEEEEGVNLEYCDSSADNVLGEDGRVDHGQYEGESSFQDSLGGGEKAVESYSSCSLLLLFVFVSLLKKILNLRSFMFLMPIACILFYDMKSIKISHIHYTQTKTLFLWA